MLPVPETVIVFFCANVSLLVVLIPSSVPVVVKAPVTLTVSPPFIVLPLLVVVPDVMVKSVSVVMVFGTNCGLN